VAVVLNKISVATDGATTIRSQVNTTNSQAQPNVPITNLVVLCLAG